MLLVVIGFLVGAFGTMIGVGGGFIIIPTLLFLKPGVSSAWVSAASMWVVAMNATSGSLTYFLKGRVHSRSALIFIAAGFPGNWLGVWMGHHVNRPMFELCFGAAMLMYAALLLLKGSKAEGSSKMNARSPLPPYLYMQGALISFAVGIMASFFGIGGGVIHVPLLVHLLNFPVHLATGTSHMILAISAWFTVMIHLLDGDIQLSDPVLWQLGIAAAAGAQVGALLSHRVPGLIILKALAVAIFLVGLRLIVINYQTLLDIVGSK